MSCDICNNQLSNYKCPICRVPYCSLNCFQDHKLKKCEPYKNVTEENTTEVSNTEGEYNYVTRATIKIDKLKLLETNKELQNILTNPHLRNILKVVDSSKNAADIMESAMREPLFVEFADVCLKIVENEVD